MLIFTNKLRKSYRSVSAILLFLFLLYLYLNKEDKKYKESNSVVKFVHSRPLSFPVQKHIFISEKVQNNTKTSPSNFRESSDKINNQKLHLSGKHVIIRPNDVIQLSALVENVTNETCKLYEIENSFSYNSTVVIDEKIECVIQVENNFRDFPVKLGGFYSPKLCQARYRVAIIVPYRNRVHMLAIFLNHMHPFLIKQNIDYGIYLVEPKHDLKFNRGLLLNIGFTESLKLSDNYWRCFIFHDVDLLPEDERNYYSCPPELKPRHMSSLVSTLDYKLPYNEIFGGVTAMTKEQFQKVNGYSNLYFGWGGEDDDLRFRIVNTCMMVSRYPLEFGRYLMVNHEKDKNPNPHRYRYLNDVFKNMKHDGLNTLKYQVVRVRRKKLYTHIVVTYNETKIISEKYKSLNLTDVAGDIPI